MPERVDLIAYLAERGQTIDPSASDAQLAERIAALEAHDASAGAPALDRAQLEQYLQARGIDYDHEESDEALQAQVLALRDAEHARFLENYQPVITRLPAAVGSSPEQPEPADEESGAASTDAADAQPEQAATSIATPAAEPGAQSGSDEAPSGDASAASEGEPGQA